MGKQLRNHRQTAVICTVICIISLSGFNQPATAFCMPSGCPWISLQGSLWPRSGVGGCAWQHANFGSCHAAQGSGDRCMGHLREQIATACDMPPICQLFPGICLQGVDVASGSFCSTPFEGSLPAWAQGPVNNNCYAAADCASGMRAVRCLS